MRRSRSARGAEPPLWLQRLRWRVRGHSARVALPAGFLAGTLVLELLPPTGSPGVSGRGLLLLAAFVLVVAVVGGAVGAALLRRRDRSLPRLVARDRAATIAVVVGILGITVGGILHRPAVVAAQERYDAMIAEARRLARDRAPDYAVRRLGQEDVRRLSPDVLRVCFPVGRPDRAWCAIVRRDDGVPRARTDSDSRPNAVAAADAAGG